MLKLYKLNLLFIEN